MSVDRIVQEALDKNPLGLKEAFAEEITARMALALEAKRVEFYSESKDEDEDDEDEDDDSDEADDADGEDTEEA